MARPRAGGRAPGSGATRSPRRSSDRDEFERVRPRLVAAARPRPRCWAGWPTRRGSGGRRGGWLTDGEAAALAAHGAGSRRAVGADVALLDELRVLLGEPPRPDRPRATRSRASTSPGRRPRTVHRDRSATAATPERPPRPDDYDDYAHVARRRGAGSLADAVADARPARAVCELDDRRGPRAERRGRTRPRPPGPRRGAAAASGAPCSTWAPTTGTRRRSSTSPPRWSGAAVPDADLPDAVRAHRRRAGAPPVRRPGWSRAVGGRGGRAAPGPGRRHGRRDHALPAGRARGGAGRRPRGPTVQVVDAMRGQGSGVRRAWSSSTPDEIAAESPAGVRVLYVALTRATHRLVTIATSPWPRPPFR